MSKKIFFLFSFSFLLLLSSSAQLKWPAVTSTTKPWTRWWWEGSAVNIKDLTWNLEQYQKAGLGGVEITPIYGVYGYEKQFVSFLTPQWMQLLTHTLKESKRLKLGVDLANATGWPFGGPWVTDEDASKSVYYKTYAINGGESLKEPVQYVQVAMVRTANNKPASIDTIKQPVSANTNLQSLALDQILYPGNLPLQTLMAYSDNGTITDLTSKVDKSGILNWTAPPGKWNLYALFVGLHGKMVERAAPGGEGYAIDHFSAQAARDYFKKFDQAFKGHDLSYLRAFFNDSYEVDDARGQANWTPLFFEEFKQRRGYDLKEYLPALFGKDDKEKNARVLYDYRATIDEMILHHFTEEWNKWGASKGKMVRNQSHGSPANTLDLYDAVDIPETEGNDILRFKFATSAANVSGKKLVSSESCTWLNEHFMSSWGDVKKAIDLYFLGGVNHIFYHGTEYSPKDAPWPGWLFYAAVHFQPVNPQYKDFPTLNEYITRVQSFLQSSRPDNDVLVYYPIIDRYSQPGNVMLQHFDGMERNFEGTDFEHISKWMLEHGYGFDFFSDRQLQRFSNSGNQILTGSNKYKAIVLPANELISVESFQKLIELVKQGGQLLVYKNLPADVPGLANLDERRKLLAQLKQQLQFVLANNVERANLGKGIVIIANDIQTLFDQSTVRQDDLETSGLSFIRRKNDDGTVYFVNNRTDKVFKGWLTLKRNASYALFDPMTGGSGYLNSKPGSEGNDQVPVELRPFESVIIQAYRAKNKPVTAKKDQPYFPRYRSIGTTTAIKGPWTLEFLSGGPVLPAKQSISELGSWTDLSGNDVKNFSGTAKYVVSFNRPSGNAKAWLLNLGRVNETAEVFLNGKRLGTLIGPNFELVIASADLHDENTLEVIVANLMANRIIYMDKNNLPWKIFYNTNMPARKRENVKNGLFDASSWSPLPSGLSGPVILTPLDYDYE